MSASSLIESLVLQLHEMSESVRHLVQNSFHLPRRCFEVYHHSFDSGVNAATGIFILLYSFHLDFRPLHIKKNCNASSVTNVNNGSIELWQINEGPSHTII
ncbi:hypothetical protein AAZX31_07G242700 [Glycine max]|uniref:Uncharacterized protein n=2 Tax=Glycine subgen. Soja TaxID=1462606 RepID=A0A0R0J8M1_SOYBN|nr:hypothetical protein JHK85_020349 [Glycine max]RZC04725.1 hypothetical protein D0Y65_019040 [Glycine soja]KAG5039079.1 hypothetical protein JHK86_019919 [Glycine max]KAG5144204.1 hypothetical protein JHK82_019899 [Glycine max]KAH1088702.1 hypothetical protein GYH30_019635 [Glycine max]